MKNIKHILIFIFSLALITSCQEDDLTIGDLVTPSNIQVSLKYLDDPDGDGTYEETAAPGLGSGIVQLSATADNATSFHVVVQGITKLQSSGMVEHNFTVLGNNTYPITVVAYGTGGISSSKTIEVDVLALYEPPADLLEMLYANGTRTWKIAADVNKHFGLGPPGGSTQAEWYGAGPNEKAGTGMYDDRYIFNEDGTITHDTGDDGWIFGRDGLINELDALGGSGGEADGADIIQYVFDDYTENWSITAPGGVETLSLTGIGFFGYYIGGNHQYIIHSRSDNEMILKTLDGNGEFTWWFTLIPE
ncbi:MAG: glucan endo-1,3-beta-D-glucosidase [Flavobacteriaceae bacterium]|nr:glucan endo-1,3-beta-D-glucosidase [Bacteroidia bacterium]NNL16527.1 glucan endo-1,3-beta-D-glucosidase [Flavobacteriaceae bacterium]